MITIGHEGNDGFRLKALSHLLGAPRTQLVALILFGLLLRVSTFGHPNMDSDEAFYFMIGQAMHDGRVPYVDLWDRKPFGLFVLYYLLAGISHSVVVYQVAAWLFASLTAWVIALIVAEMANPRGGLLAGLIYLSTLPLFFGWGGQAPVFYNLFVVLAGWLVLKALPGLHSGKPEWRADLAMLLCGVAITIKQTTVFESSYFGLFCSLILVQSGVARSVVLTTMIRWMALGAMPTVLVSFGYWSSGYWYEYWQAMFESNLAKQSATPVTLLSRAIDLYWRLFPLLCVSLIGLLLRADGPNAGKHRQFLIGWLVAAWIGFLVVPNLYPHYVLPLLVPLCVAAGLLFSRRDIGFAFFTILIAISLWRYSFYNFERTQSAMAAIASLAQSIKEHDNGRGLLIFDGPILLYPLTGHRPPSALALPLHLNYEIERNVSHLDTNAEVARILADRPGVVLVPGKSRNNPDNETAFRMVKEYVINNCRLVGAQYSSEMFRTDPILVYGDCFMHTAGTS